jgi:hypothetical protein
MRAFVLDLVSSSQPAFRRPVDLTLCLLVSPSPRLQALFTDSPGRGRGRLTLLEIARQLGKDEVDAALEGDIGFGDGFHAALDAWAADVGLVRDGVVDEVRRLELLELVRPGGPVAGFPSEAIAAHLKTSGLAPAPGLRVGFSAVDEAHASARDAQPSGQVPALGPSG